MSVQFTLLFSELNIGQACLGQFELTIREHHRLGGLNNKHLVLTVQKVGKSNNKVPENAVSSEGAFLWFASSHHIVVSFRCVCAAGWGWE